MSLYDIVGAAKNATKEQIKKAYRKKAAIHHPDKNGDPANFKALVLAYNILSDEEKRERYDSGESAESIDKLSQSEDEKIRMLVLGMFIQVVMNIDLKRQSVPEWIGIQIKNNMNSIKEMVKKQEAIISRFELVLKKLKTASEDNIFSQSANNEISNCKWMIENLQNEERVGQGALKLLEAYSYELDPAVMDALNMQSQQQMAQAQQQNNQTNQGFW